MHNPKQDIKRFLQLLGDKIQYFSNLNTGELKTLRDTSLFVLRKASLFVDHDQYKEAFDVVQALQIIVRLHPNLAVPLDKHLTKLRSMLKPLITQQTKGEKRRQIRIKTKPSHVDADDKVLDMF